MAAEERWYFTKEQLANTPSRKCGYDADKELSCRQQAANLIQDMGQRLQVTQLCINTAIVYMHRFYMFHSFTKFHRNSMASAALFLAAKVEEQPRKLEHVIKVAQVCLNREPLPLDIRSEAYNEQAQDLIMNENILLQTLGFDVAIDHPHTHVVRCCHLVRAEKDLAQTSYFMASNSLHLTTMCLQYKPTVVACFCIHLASQWSNWEIPQSNEGRPWFYYVDRTVTQELLEQLTTEFLVIFEKCPSRLKRKIMSCQVSSNAAYASASRANQSSMEAERRRERGDNSTNYLFPPNFSTANSGMPSFGGLPPLNQGTSTGGSSGFGSNSDDGKKRLDHVPRMSADYKKHLPHHPRPDSHNVMSKSSCMFGSSSGGMGRSIQNSSSSSGGSNNARPRDHHNPMMNKLPPDQQHRIRRPDHHPPQSQQLPSRTSNSSINDMPLFQHNHPKKLTGSDKISSSSSSSSNISVTMGSNVSINSNSDVLLPPHSSGSAGQFHNVPDSAPSSFPFSSSTTNSQSSISQAMGHSSSHHKMSGSSAPHPPLLQQELSVLKDNSSVAQTPFSLPPSLKAHPPAPVEMLPKTPPIAPKVERSIFSPEDKVKTPPSSGINISPFKIKPISPIHSQPPSFALEEHRARKRPEESAVSSHSATAVVKPEPLVGNNDHNRPTAVGAAPPTVPLHVPKEEPHNVVHSSPSVVSTLAPEQPSLSPSDAKLSEDHYHKEKKKKKKKHREHKEKKEKHKHKHKSKDPEPIVITIPKEKITLNQTDQVFKIKIPKDKISPPPPTPPSTPNTGQTPRLKIKISKDKLREGRKRERSEERESSHASKHHRPNGTTLQIGLDSQRHH